MIVLSLFDGMSCGRVALERAGIPITKYYASEIDKYAIQVSKKNYSSIIQLGDVNDWHISDCGNHAGWWSFTDPDKFGVCNNIEKPDLIIGGSPCQGFSFAGKQLAFDDPRSALFWKYVEIVKYYKPKYFLLENVRMKKEYLQVITDALGVEPICINSGLVSAQNRVRYYWTNIPNVTQPEDKGIVLKDIIEHGVCDRDKSFCIDANYWKGGDLKQYFEKHRRQLVFSKNYVQWDATGKGHKSQDQRAFYLENKHGTLPSNNGQSKCKIIIDKQYKQDKFLIRKLTPVECERLQTLPDNYTEGVSNTQRYKMLGNGWTVDVIAHIFSCINIYNEL
jgi:DNA-cytosine methyltransferase